MRTVIVVTFLAIVSQYPIRTPESHKFVINGVVFEPGIPLMAGSGVNLKIIIEHFHILPPCTDFRND
jgi:hypothetical protein